jgi:hypothetical protein
LTGKVPFYEDNEYDLFESIKIGTVYYPISDWKGISPEAKHFVQKMLTTDEA